MFVKKRSRGKRNVVKRLVKKVVMIILNIADCTSK